MRLGSRRPPHHQRFHSHGFPITRFITKCTLPCFSQSQYASSDLGSDLQRGSLLDNQRQPNASWEPEGLEEDDDLDMRLSMFSNTQGQELEGPQSSSTHNNNNSLLAGMSLDARCLAVNDNHQDISSANEHAQEHAQSDATGQQVTDGPGDVSGHLGSPTENVTGRNNNSLLRLFPQTPMALYRRIWQNQHTFTRYNQFEEVHVPGNQRTPSSPLVSNESPLFRFPRDGTPLIGRRSLFDPSLWQPLLWSGNTDTDNNAIQGGAVFRANLNEGVHLYDHQNNNHSLHGQQFYEIAGATDQESSDEVSQISTWSRACSSPVDFNIFRQNTTNIVAAEVHNLNPVENQNQQNETSNSPSGSARSSLRNQRREWYFYDPRLMPGDRADRIMIETHFRGVHNEFSLPAMTGPPAYEDIVGGEVYSLEPAAISSSPNWVLGSPPSAEVVRVPEDPPPPYSELPPSYEQTMANDMLSGNDNLNIPAAHTTNCDPFFEQSSGAIAICHGNRVTNFNNFNAIRLGNLQSSPVTNQLAAINEVNCIADDLDFDLDIDLDLMEVEGSPYNDDRDEENDFDNLDIDGMFDLDTDELDPSDPEEEGQEAVNPRSLSRYPVGFCLGQRPAVRWSRGMGFDRWASSQNWAI